VRTCQKKRKEGRRKERRKGGREEIKHKYQTKSS
jgi:hypothetical protein